MTLQRISTGALEGNLEKADLDTLQRMAEAMESLAPEVEAPDKVIVAPKGDETAPMMRTPSKSAGFIYLWRGTDGKRVQVNRNMLLQKLEQRLPNGAPAFLSRRPTNITPFVGTERCLLHPEHPDYAKRASLGLKVCPKKNLANREAAYLHLQKKHPLAWQMIQAADQREREDRRDRLQEMQTEAIIAGSRLRAPTDPAVKERLAKARAAKKEKQEKQEKAD